MPRSGGVYSQPNGTAAVANATASSSAFNTLIDDIGDEITNSLPRDGTAAMTADLPMGGNQVANMGDGSLVSDAVNVKQLQHSTIPWADAGGSADALTGNYTPDVTTLADGMRLRLRAASANTTTTPTFSPDGLTARTIVKYNGQALVAGDIAGDGHELFLVYDLANTRWTLLNPATTPTVALSGVNINGATAVTDVDETADYFPVYNNGATANRKVLGRYIGAGTQTLFVPAAAMIPRTTNGAGSTSGETSTNKVMRYSRDFDASTEEYAQFAVRMPKGWNEGTITATFQWSHASTTTNFGVVWGIQGVAISDDDTLEVAFGTAQTVTDTGGTTDDLYQTAATSAVTIAGTPQAGDYVIFQVYRKAADAADTMAIDARLHGVTIFYVTDANTDD